MTWYAAIFALLVKFWPAVLAVIVPYVAGALSDRAWSKATKTWIAFAVSIAVGLLGTLVAGIGLTPETLTIYTTTVFAISVLAHGEFRRHEITSVWLDRLLALGSKTPF